MPPTRSFVGTEDHPLPSSGLVGRAIPVVRAAKPFLDGVAGLIGQHALLGSAAATALLASGLFLALALGGGLVGSERFDLVQQEPSGQEAVLPLVSRGLALT